MQPPVGPLTDVTKELYMEREADSQALLHLKRGEIVTVIEPRQQGKTSLIYALRRHPAMQSVAIVYIDVSTLRKNNAVDWYHDFCKRLLEQLSFIKTNQRPSHPIDSSSFRSFLAILSKLLVQLDKDVIVVLDEVATLRFPGSTEFFAVLRDVFNSREAERYFWRITFMLVGVFRPRDLIQDPMVSPFNVAIRVSLNDFNLVQTVDLIKRYGVANELADGLAESIYYWTDGQPYLCQALCSRLSSGSAYDRLLRKDISPAIAVEEEVDRLFRSDDNHINALINRLNETLGSQIGIFDELEKIVQSRNLDFYPAALPWQEDLQLLGIIKEAPDHMCVIRNRIYAKALDISFKNRKSAEIASFHRSAGQEKNRSQRWMDGFKSVLAGPKPLGRFVFDLFGRHNAAESSSALMGWVLILVAILIFQGLVPLDAIVKWFKSIWSFFSP